MSSDDLIKKVILNMKYDSKKTLNENLIVINEESTSCPTNMEYDTYYKRCKLSSKIQKNLSTSMGVPQNMNGIPNNVLVDNNDEWYAVYALWLAQEIEAYKGRNIWNDDPNGYCKGTGVLSMMVRYENNDISLQKAFEDKTKRRLVCFNDKIAVYKPYDKIDWNNLSSSSGRVNKNSIKRYDDYIPSYADVIKAYGWQGNYSTIMSGLEKNKDRWHSSANITNRGDVLASKPRTGLENLDTHDLLTILQIGSFFLPIIGPIVSLGIGLGDAALYYSEGEEGMAALVAGFSFLFDIPGVKTVFKEFAEGGIKSLTKEELENIASATLNQNFKTISQKEKDFLLKIKNNWTTTKEGLEKFAKDKSNYILNDANIAPKLSTGEKTALQKYAQNSVKFDKPLKAIGVGGTAGVGAAEGKRIAGKYDENWNKNIKSIIEDEGYKWDSVKKIFGSSGSAEDNTKLKDAWLENWRPGDKIPAEYQTELYKQNVISQFEKSLSTLSSEDSEKQSEQSSKIMTSLSKSLFKSKESVAKLDSIKTANLKWAETNDTGGVPYTGDFNDF